MSLVDECWEWNGARDRDGYGKKKSALSSSRLAHRIAYEWAYGPIPAGIKVLHRCDNPPCVNPRHLFLGTHTDNMRDKCSKNRHHQQKKTHCKNGHPFSGTNLVRYGGYRTCRICHRAKTRRAVARFRAKIDNPDYPKLETRPIG